jgi:hypothetical protein
LGFARRKGNVQRFGRRDTGAVATIDEFAAAMSFNFAEFE